MMTTNKLYSRVFGTLLSALLLMSCSEDTIDENGIGSLEGTVVAQGSNEPLGQVKISTNPSSASVFTNSEGEFRIPNIQSGDYAVQAELTGFLTSFESVNIIADETSSVIIEMAVNQSNNQAPDVPELFTPEDGDTDLLSTANFVWSDASNDNDQITYTLELRNSTTNEIQNFNVVQDTTLTVNNLTLGSTYFWQVTAADPFNEGVSSDISQFGTFQSPSNPFFFVREIDGNSVIFSGSEDEDDDDDEDTSNELQLTSTTTNSFNPRRNRDVNKVAFLRSVGGNIQLFTMNVNGTDVRQLTTSIPVSGFRNDEINIAWADGGSKIYYPNFDRLYSINSSGGGLQSVYQTTDGSLISEVAVPDFDPDLLVIKTNNINGYDVRIFTYRISTGTEETVILEGVNGAAGGIDITANADRVLYSRDLSGSENNQYRRFQSRLFEYDLNTNLVTEVDTGADPGFNDLKSRFSPNEASYIYERVANNVGAAPNLFITDQGDTQASRNVFQVAGQPDWE
ncbi:carboxypeptidase-like regulatory domain-containing protein [Croceiramulus getboli]|nr:carboxypeptidase-like regulatory domain-containing protein [Flavobacteriaceae bacterium YJPT1-3]